MPKNSVLKEYILWQLPINESFKSMSYCIKTADDLNFVIDGGDCSETEYLVDFINDKLDGRVDAWFITHPHKSHTGAFNRIVLEELCDIKKIIYSYIDPEETAKYESTRVHEVESFNNTIKLSKIPSVRVRNGDRLKLGKNIVKIICVPGSDPARDYINNHGVIYKFNFKTASVLFLGDVGNEAGLSLLASFKDELKCDILQMAHHGFYGVSNELYGNISPDICLWPTRRELWPNGNKLMSNEMKEIKSTYDFMCSLGITEHYVAGIDGLSEIHI